MYDIEITIDRKGGRTELRGTDLTSPTPQDALVRSLVDIETHEGDKGLTIKVVHIANTVPTRTIHPSCYCHG